MGADGASYREIIDVSNWDNSITINTPGQSGQPESPYYGNLLPLWAKDEYFPMAFSRGLVDQNDRAPADAAAMNAVQAAVQRR